MRLWTERFGGAGDPVVLLIMGTSAQGIGWPDELVRNLAEGGRRVIRFDHRDTGQSDCVDFTRHPYTLGDMADDARAVLDGHKVRPAHIVGAFLGEATGQLLAACHGGGGDRPEVSRQVTAEDLPAPAPWQLAVRDRHVHARPQRAGSGS